MGFSKPLRLKRAKELELRGEILSGDAISAGSGVGNEFSEDMGSVFGGGGHGRLFLTILQRGEEGVEIMEGVTEVIHCMGRGRRASFEDVTNHIGIISRLLDSSEFFNYAAAGNGDAVPFQDRLIVGIIFCEVNCDRLEPVPGDDEAGGVTHDVVEEHLSIIRTRLDQDNIYLGVRSAKLFEMVMQTGVKVDPGHLIGNGLQPLFT
jgi:hypothetical protein